MKKTVLRSIIPLMLAGHLQAADQFSATATGDITRLGLTVAISPDSSISGTSGNVYLGANLAGSWYFKTPEGWKSYTGGAIPAYTSGSLSQRSIQVFDGHTDLSSFLGAQIYAGVGRDEADMIANRRYARVFTANPVNLMIVSRKAYDGRSDDLLTAGLGQTGIGSATSPAAVSGFSATNPADLRRLAIWANYRAIMDPSNVGGFGRLYGPNVSLSGNGTFNGNDGRIAGEEWIGIVDPGDGSEMVEVMVQIPAHFDKTKPCIVAGPSSGSRGIYGAIGTSGEWGLKRGCAVAYSDVGKGNGFHDLASGKVTRADGVAHGVRAQAFDAAGNVMTAFPAFLARDAAGNPITPTHAYNTQYPNMQAVKHFHSRQNPEAKWGQYTLASIRFALNAINEKYAERDANGLPTTQFVPKGKETAGQTGVIVIASSVSNGGGASLRAAEEDSEGLITGVVVHEPNIYPDPALASFAVQYNGKTMSSRQIRQLADQISVWALYQPCASLAQTSAQSYNALNSLGQQANRCKALARNGLLAGIADVDTADAATVLAAAQAAQRAINDAYLIEEANPLAPQYDVGFNYSAIMAYYAPAYARASVTENFCGWGMAVTNAAGAIVPPAAASDALVFGVGNGLAGWGPLPVYLQSLTSAKSWLLSISPSTGLQDLAFDGTLCAHRMFTNFDPANGGRGLTGTDASNALRVQGGMRELRASGNLREKPAIILHGRMDALVAVNHTSRAYFGLNKRVEGGSSKLSYIEVEHGHHLEAFNQLPGFATRVVPAHAYLPQALNAMYAHLTSGSPLPQSQVVRTVPRGSATENITDTNVPPLQLTAAPANQIQWDGNTVLVPK